MAVSRCALNKVTTKVVGSKMLINFLVAVAGSFSKVLINWFWMFAGGSNFHKGLVRLLYFPSVLRMCLLEGPKRRWYDRIDSTVILGALPFRGNQTKEVKSYKQFLCHVNRITRSFRFH